MTTKAACAVFGCLIAAICSASAEESAAARSIRLTFLPPPLEGTISLGIYDEHGKLVRVLHRESDINEFEIGPDALATTWDGKDDAGENVSPGKYSAHGFVVGDLGIEGVGFFFNDWISADDSPRFSRIRSVALRDENLFLAVELVPPGPGHVLYDLARKTMKLLDTDAPDSPNDTPTANGRDGTRWTIEPAGKDSPIRELKQFSASGEFMRRLAAPAEDPQPIAVAPSTTQDRIFLLEENNAMQRVRALSLVGKKSDGSAGPISEWKVEFEKKIVAHKDFSIADGKPVVSASNRSDADESVKIKLMANPLANDNQPTVEFEIGFDADGSFLKTSDGLPLCTISETQEVTRALIGARDKNAIDVFQDDGAVVEQFRVTGVDQMMAFDCGGFEVK